MSIKKYCVSRNDNIFEAWPDLALTNNGKLICIFTECKAHTDRDLSRIMLTESNDKGKTWTKKHPLTDYSSNGEYYNNARITKLKNGDLVITCDYLKGFDKSDDAKIHLWISKNDGKTWDEPIITPATGIVPDKLIETSTGRWLLACHRLNSKTDKLEERLIYSDNKGKTWSSEVLVASDERYNLCEASIIETKNGTLVAVLRENSFMGYDGFKAFSYDNGETWEGVFHIPVPGLHRPTMGYLKNGRIMITHRFIQTRAYQNLFASFISEEDLLKKERNEQHVRIMPIDYDRSKFPDLGYSGWVQFEDEDIYVVNYIVDNAPNAQIRGYRFSMGDVEIN